MHPRRETIALATEPQNRTALISFATRSIPPVHTLQSKSGQAEAKTPRNIPSQNKQSYTSVRSTLYSTCAFTKLVPHFFPLLFFSFTPLAIFPRFFNTNYRRVLEFVENRSRKDGYIVSRSFTTGCGIVPGMKNRACTLGVWRNQRVNFMKSSEQCARMRRGLFTITYCIPRFPSRYAPRSEFSRAGGNGAE